MAIGLYKPGQGYWVRVLTATLIGVITLAAAAWMYTQMSLVASKMPRSVWAMPYSQGGTAPASGEPVTLLGKAPAGIIAPEIGTATVDSFNAGAGELRLKNVSTTDGSNDASLAAAIKVGSGTPVTLTRQAQGMASIDPRLIQGVAMAVVLLIGAMLAYFFVAMYQKFVDFLIATDGEMKKVNWSTSKDIRMSTMVVIFASVMLAGSLFAVDFAFQWFFKTIGILAG